MGAVCRFAGTGKSTLARALATQLGAAVLDKDRVRAALFPGSLTDYSAEQAHLCMQAMTEAAAYLTQRQVVPFIFIDGRTFSRRLDIEEVLQAPSVPGPAGALCTWSVQMRLQ